MAKKIVWSREALKDLVSIAEYIERDSKYYASVFVNEIYEKAGTLNTFYNRGRIVPEILDENTREIFVRDYRLIYKIERKCVSI
jgi:addiction module RelE/StbE family toxin